jgi:aspartate kinase
MIGDSFLRKIVDELSFFSFFRCKGELLLSRIVMKFGGTSVGNTERIRNVAQRVIRETAKGHEIVVVVSAMGKTTYELVRLAKDLAFEPSNR